MKILSFLSFLLPFFVFVSSGAGGLAADFPGSSDHPRVPRLSGYEIVEYSVGDFASHTFEISDEESVTVEGKFWKIDYMIPEGGAPKAALEIARNYQEAFKAKGGSSYEGSLDLSGGRAFAWMTEENGAETWLDVEVSNQGEYYILMIVEKAPLKQSLEIGANEMVKSLQENGNISLYGIYFDTGKADIKPESSETINAIVEALNALPDMRIEIGGHTDNVGGEAYNQELSEKRAEAVKKAVIAKGISAERLESEGYGLSKPVESNDTDEGRAKNRRVELSKL